MVRVVGIDPGLSRCGVGVVDGPSARPTIARAGVIRTPPGDAVSRRLRALYDELSALLADARPDAVAVERVFFSSNVRTAMGTGQAAGVALLCAEQAGVPVVEYTPTQVKLTVAGSGRADKEQVTAMVRILLDLAEAPRPADTADALALALCHLQHVRGTGATAAPAMSARLAAAVASAGPGAQVVRRRP